MSSGSGRAATLDGRKRLRIFISGPLTNGVLGENIERASQTFFTLMREGMAPFCPHWSCFSGPPAGPIPLRPVTPGTKQSWYAWAELTPRGTTHADWLGVDLAWVQASDALLRLPGESKGADAEEFEAVKWGIPVFHSIEELIAWGRGRS